MLKESKPNPRRARWLLAGGVAALLITAVSCETVTRTVVVPPNIPGAKFVGSKACSECHDDVYKGFMKTATHARLVANGPNALNMGCESCHGPGSLHADSGGEKRTANNYRPGDPQVRNVGLRQTILNPRRSGASCFGCHVDKQAQFALPYHHAVPEGRMSCNDCHDPHKGPMVKGGAAFIAEANETCIKCHPKQRGPYVFEHEAMREGCISCHDPHGSVNAKMLVARNQNLCAKCHMQQQVSGGAFSTFRIGAGVHGFSIGGNSSSVLTANGTCWTTGCHEAIHGSQVNAHLRF